MAGGVPWDRKPTTFIYPFLKTCTKCFARNPRLRESRRRISRGPLTDWLKSRKKERRRAEIAAFAKEYGGTDLDLDRDLEAAGIEVVQAES
jgi:hypothetical protein